MYNTDKLKEMFLIEIEATSTYKEIEDLRNKWLGRKGIIKNAFKDLGERNKRFKDIEKEMQKMFENLDIFCNEPISDIEQFKKSVREILSYCEELYTKIDLEIQVLAGSN